MSFFRLIHFTTALTIATAAIAASGCSDPATPPPQGAFSATLGGVTCPVSANQRTIGVGKATGQSKETIPDGESNTSVSCRVSADGETLSVQATIQSGSSSIFVQGTTSREKGGTASISLTGPGLPSTLVLPSGQSCTLTLVDGASGKIWAGFECAGLDVQGQFNSSCTVSEGWVVLENCDS